MNHLGGFVSAGGNTPVTNSGVLGNVGSITLTVGMLYIFTAYFNYSATGLTAFTIQVSGGGSTTQNIPMSPQVGNPNFYLSNTTQYITASGTGIVYLTASFTGAASISGSGYIFGIRIG